MARLLSLFDESPEEPPSPFGRLLQRVRHPLPLARYLFAETETHAYCGALAFFALLAFYPSSFLLLALANRMGEQGGPQEVVAAALREYYPQAQAFLLRNLEASVAQHGQAVHLGSVFWVFLGAAGVFVPLESALNRLWGFGTHRPYWSNQAVGLALTAAGGALAVAFVLGTTALRALVEPGPLLGNVLLRAGAVALTVCAIFLFYRFLPNGPIATRDVLPAALLAGAVAEAVRSGFLHVLPHLGLRRTQGPYFVSISFALLVYVEAFVVLGGAFLASPAAAPRPRGEGG